MVKRTLPELGADHQHEENEGADKPSGRWGQKWGLEDSGESIKNIDPVDVGGNPRACAQSYRASGLICPKLYATTFAGR